MAHFIAALFLSILMMSTPTSPASEDVTTPSTPDFYIEKVSEAVEAQMTGVSYHEGAPVPIEDLRIIHVGYIDFEGNAQTGELMVHHAVSEDLIEIFKILYENNYPIEKIQRIEAYEGDDDLSMTANNTSAFNHRKVAGSAKLSLHAYGLAVDINPVQNPYVTDTEISPSAGEDYVDRTRGSQGMILKGDICYEAFVERGWQWGGDWKSIKDYQHFQKKSDEIIKP